MIYYWFDHRRAPQTDNARQRTAVPLKVTGAVLQRSDAQAHVPMAVPLASSQFVAAETRPHPLKTISPPASGKWTILLVLGLKSKIVQIGASPHSRCFVLFSLRNSGF